MSGPNTYGLFIGINYPNTANELAGCVNDAKDYEETFAPFCCQHLTLFDKDAVKSRILDYLEISIAGLKNRDRLLITFSGHGTWLPDVSGDEPDGKDEALCPYDLDANVILDDELQELFKKRVKGSKIIFITDCCHSGTVYRFAGLQPADKKIRFLPPSRLGFLSKVKEKKAEGKERAVLAAPIIKKDNKPISGLIHFSGCQDTEYSYDAWFEGRANGAFTKNFLDIYREAAPRTSWDSIMAELREKLPSYDYPQRPKLNATSSDKRNIAIGK